jgi:hypothetical protein
MAEDLKRVCLFVCQLYDHHSSPSPKAEILLETLVRPAIDRLRDFDIRMFEHEHETGTIQKNLIEEIQSADLMVADLSELSSSGYFEVGFRRAIDLPLVLIADTDHVVPFDTAAFRVVRYSTVRQGPAADEVQSLIDAISEELEEQRGARGLGPPPAKRSPREQRIILAERIEEAAHAIQLLRINSLSDVTEDLRSVAQELKEASDEQTASALSIAIQKALNALSSIFDQIATTTLACLDEVVRAPQGKLPDPLQICLTVDGDRQQRHLAGREAQDQRPLANLVGARTAQRGASAGRRTGHFLHEAAGLEAPVTTQDQHDIGSRQGSMNEGAVELEAIERSQFEQPLAAQAEPVPLALQSPRWALLPGDGDHACGLVLLPTAIVEGQCSEIRDRDRGVAAARRRNDTFPHDDAVLEEEDVIREHVRGRGDGADLDMNVRLDDRNVRGGKPGDAAGPRRGRGRRLAGAGKPGLGEHAFHDGKLPVEHGGGARDEQHHDVACIRLGRVEPVVLDRPPGSGHVHLRPGEPAEAAVALPLRPRLPLQHLVPQGSVHRCLSRTGLLHRVDVDLPFILARRGRLRDMEHDRIRGPASPARRHDDGHRTDDLRRVRHRARGSDEDGHQESSGTVDEHFRPRGRRVATLKCGEFEFPIRSRRSLVGNSNSRPH